MCEHLSRLDRLDGLTCSFCEDGGPLANAEIQARYGPLNIAHRRRARRGGTLPIASATRGALRLIGPYLIVITALILIGFVSLGIETTVKP